jgi:maleate isomerase
LRARSETRLGLVTPYTDDVQAAIVATFGQEGIDVVRERHLGIRDNFSFSGVKPNTISGMVDDVAHARPDAIAIFCTNLAGAPLVAELETRHDIAIHDSVVTAVYGALRSIGQPTHAITHYGRLFGGP